MGPASDGTRSVSFNRVTAPPGRGAERTSTRMSSGKLRIVGSCALTDPRQRHQLAFVTQVHTYDGVGDFFTVRDMLDPERPQPYDRPSMNSAEETVSL